MAIELTEQQRNLLNQNGGQPVEFVDPGTKQVYVLVARDNYDQEASIKRDHAQKASPAAAEIVITEGVRRSREALRRDLPALLKNKKLRGQWAAYRGDERIGIAKREIALVRECSKRGFADDEFYIEEEELEPRP